MNKVILAGRLTRDPEFRANASGDGGTTRFSVAVNRRFKNAEGNYDADFPNCVAFGKTAEFVSNYFKKGMMIGICGRLQTGSYVNKDGATVYTTDVVVDEAEFLESKNASGNDTGSQPATAPAADNFQNIPANIDEELPFA